MNIIIKSTNYNLTDKDRELIMDKLSKVDKFYSSITEIRVEVQYDHQRSQGDVYRCEANVVVPGKLIRVEKYTDSFEKSVNKVKDHLKVVLSKERKKLINRSRRDK